MISHFICFVKSFLKKIKKIVKLFFYLPTFCFLSAFLYGEFTNSSLYSVCEKYTLIPSIIMLPGGFMFGYVRPHVPSLRVREYEWYRAVYCGLCRTMGQVSGQGSRFTLSYDFAFLALVRILLTETPSFQRHRCPVHPVHARLMAEENPALRYTAAAAAYLTEAKRLDDCGDETGLARLQPVLLSPVTRPMVHFDVKREPDTAVLFTCIREHLDRLSALEKAGCTSPEETAQVFGDLLGELFSFGLNGSAGTVARSVGVGTGRFIYLCDAMDDLAEDLRRGRYNPLAMLWGDMALGDDGKPSEPVKSAFADAALIDLEKLGLAAELLPQDPLTEIVKNIVYIGMPDMVKRIVEGRSPGSSHGLHSLHTAAPESTGGSQI